jgi:hypothetical protein
MRRTPLYGLLLIGSVLSLSANAVLEWNAALLDAIRAETSPPPLAARNLAIVHIAIHDAVNTGHLQKSGYLSSEKSDAPLDARLLVIGAAHEACKRLYPSQRALFEKLRAKQIATEVPFSNQKALEWASSVAQAVVERRINDGAQASSHYFPSEEPGAWRRTPPYFRPPEAPHWAKVQTFALTNAAQFRPAPPPGLTSEEWARELRTVRELGGKESSARTSEQAVIAHFWSDFSYTVTPPGHWNQIAAQTVASAQISLIESARLFALLNAALADSAVACWDAKYAYNFWRPVTAIQQADRDGNPGTEAHKDWTPLLSTPPFPEFVSGHSTFSGAAAEILTRFHGTDKMTFRVGCDSLPGVYRSFNGFSEAAAEIGMSRIYGGIHYPCSNAAGLELGRKVATTVFSAFGPR